MANMAIEIKSLSEIMLQYNSGPAKQLFKLKSSKHAKRATETF